MDKAVVKPGHMSEIDNKAPMGLEEHAGREPVEPILHILYGVMIFLDRMNDDLMIYGFHRYNMCGENRAHAILRFNGKRGSRIRVQFQSALQTAEKALPVNGLGQIAENVQLHRVVQIFGVCRHDDDDHVFIELYQLLSHMETVDIRHFYIQKNKILGLLVLQQRIPIIKYRYFKRLQTAFAQKSMYRV